MKTHRIVKRLTPQQAASLDDFAAFSDIDEAIKRYRAYDPDLSLVENVAHAISELVSVTIERDYWMATTKALIGEGHGRKMAEGLDGIWISETGLKLPSEQNKLPSSRK